MAKWSFQVTTFTPVAVADTAAMTNGGFMALQGGTATQSVKIEEVYMGGQAPSASSPMIMVLAHDTVVGATPTALSSPNSNGPLDTSTAALAAPTVGMIAAGTPPQRAATVTLGKLNLSFNAFGGIVRWFARTDDQRFTIFSATQPAGEASLSSFTGSTAALIGAHIAYETV